MQESKIILDTSAIIEILEGSEKGKKANELIADEVRLVPSLVLCELTSALLRKKIDPKRILKRITESCYVLELDSDVAVQAGILHAKLRKKENGISLADCIIMEHGRKEEAKIITVDRHFRHCKKAILL